MIAKILEYLGARFTSIAFVIAFFVAVWLIAWAANGTAGTKFDLMALRDIMTFIMSKYGIDSLLNSKREEPPK